MADELAYLIPRTRVGIIQTEAENAWLDGFDADANPYNKKHQSAEWYIWYDRWKLMNLVG